MEKKDISAGNGKKAAEKFDFEVIDKRPFADVDHIPVEALEEEKPRYPTYVEELMAKLAAVEQKFEEKKKQFDQEIARTRARLEADSERRIQLEKQDLVVPFLEVLDNLERAIDAASQSGNIDGLLEGVRMIAKLFNAKLSALGVEPVEVLHQPFDPNMGQAVAVVPVAEAEKDGLVLDEIVRGYRMGEKLIRPAQVRVGVKS